LVGANIQFTKIKFQVKRVFLARVKSKW
jgi:hypothetical protein